MLFVLKKLFSVSCFVFACKTLLFLMSTSSSLQICCCSKSLLVFYELFKQITLFVKKICVFSRAGLSVETCVTPSNRKDPGKSRSIILHTYHHSEFCILYFDNSKVQQFIEQLLLHQSCMPKMEAEV